MCSNYTSIPLLRGRGCWWDLKGNLQKKYGFKGGQRGSGEKVVGVKGGRGGHQNDPFKFCIDGNNAENGNNAKNLQECKKERF